MDEPLQARPLLSQSCFSSFADVRRRGLWEDADGIPIPRVTLRKELRIVLLVHCKVAVVSNRSFRASGLPCRPCRRARSDGRSHGLARAADPRDRGMTNNDNVRIARVHQPPPAAEHPPKCTSTVYPANERQRRAIHPNTDCAAGHIALPTTAPMIDVDGSRTTFTSTTYTVHGTPHSSSTIRPSVAWTGTTSWYSTVAASSRRSLLRRWPSRSLSRRLRWDVLWRLCFGGDSDDLDLHVRGNGELNLLRPDLTWMVSNID